jgi:hypothetical protein
MITICNNTVVTIDENEWVFIYDADTKEILMSPQQCSGTYNCAQLLVVTGTLEELNLYIMDNNLKLPDYV